MNSTGHLQVDHCTGFLARDAVKHMLSAQILLCAVHKTPTYHIWGAKGIRKTNTYRIMGEAGIDWLPLELSPYNTILKGSLPNMPRTPTAQRSNVDKAWQPLSYIVMNQIGARPNRVGQIP